MNDQIIQEGISIFDEEYDIGLDNDIELGSLEDSPGDKLENSNNNSDNNSDTDAEEQKSKSSLREQVIMEEEEIEDEEVEDEEVEDVEAEEDCSEEGLGEASREGSGKIICIEDKEETESIVNNTNINLSNE